MKISIAQLSTLGTGNTNHLREDMGVERDVVEAELEGGMANALLA
jgi:hypothetical protein